MYIREAGYCGLGALLGDAEVYLFLSDKLGAARRHVTYKPEDPPAGTELYPYDRVATQIFKLMDGPARIAAEAKGKWIRFDVDIGWLFWLRSVDGRMELKPSTLTAGTFRDVLRHIQVSGTADISVELADAPPASSAEGRVFLYLLRNIDQIIATEQQFKIDRRAIAGAIAWEALANPYTGVKGDLGTSTGIARFSGPGKVHYKEFRPDRDHLTPASQEGNPVAREVEQLGRLPQRTMEERRQAVATLPGALLYIGTIMREFSDAAALGGYYLDCDPVILTTFYNGSWSIARARQYFQNEKTAPAPLAPGSTMGTWMNTPKNMALIERMVATPPPGFCKKKRGY